MQRTPAAASPPFPFPLSLRKQKETAALRGSRSPRSGKFRPPPPPRLSSGRPGGAEGGTREERSAARGGALADSWSWDSPRHLGSVTLTPTPPPRTVAAAPDGGLGHLGIFPRAGDPTTWWRKMPRGRVTAPLPSPGKKIVFPSVLQPSALPRNPRPRRGGRAAPLLPCAHSHVPGGLSRGGLLDFFLSEPGPCTRLRVARHTRPGFGSRPRTMSAVIRSSSHARPPV